MITPIACLKDRSGSIAIIAALAVLPLVLGIALLIDYSRAYATRDQMQHVLDASLLAVAHDAPQLGAAALQDKVRVQVTAQFTDVVSNMVVTASHGDNGGVQGTVSGTIKTMLAGIPAVGTISVNVVSAVAAVGDPVEVALVLDTTGTMIADMPSLRAGSRAFVDLVTSRGRNPNARIAIVPFVGSVNIGNGLTQEGWLDKEGASQHAAQTVRGRWIAVSSDPACAGASVDDPVPPRSGANWEGPFTGLKAALAEIIGVTPAVAGTPYEAVRVGCYYANPSQISNWRLFDNIPNARWKGCVEARPQPYDIDDTPPGADPNTRWVPFFSLDGADAEGEDADGNSFGVSDNDYLPDYLIPGTTMEHSERGRAFSVLKYRNVPIPNLDETPDITNGPNKNCPDPIVPLTRDRNLLDSRLAQLRDYFNGGTHTVEGISWGMRVLSPTPPFTEGAPYGRTRKLMVVFSDGGNGIAGETFGTINSPDMPFISEYTAYGYARHGRFAEESSFSGVELMNNRMGPACSLVKSKGIEIVVIAMGADADALERLRNCASDPEAVVSVERGADLVPHFQKFAMKLAPFRLIR